MVLYVKRFFCKIKICILMKNTEFVEGHKTLNSNFNESSYIIFAIEKYT